MGATSCGGAKHATKLPPVAGLADALDCDGVRSPELELVEEADAEAKRVASKATQAAVAELSFADLEAALARKKELEQQE